MEQNFATMFEDKGHERSLYLLSSLTDPDISKHSKFTDHETNQRKFLALERSRRQETIIKYIAVSFLE